MSSIFYRPALYYCQSCLSMMFSSYLLHLYLQRYVKTVFTQTCWHVCRLFDTELLLMAFSPQSGESIMVEVAAGPSDSSTHEKVSLFLNSSTPFGGVGFKTSSRNPTLIFTTAPVSLNAAFSSEDKWLLTTLMLVFSPAPHGAQSAEVKLLSTGSLWPALLPPGLWWYLSTR